MFLRELRIRNLRSIKKLTLPFASSTESNRKWTLLLGENGCGKSTVLRAIALVLAGSDALPHLLGGDVDSWVRYGAEEAVIEADLLTASGEDRAVKLQLRRGATTRSLFTDNQQSLDQIDAAVAHADRNYLTVAYGASRRLNTDPESAFQRKSGIPKRAKCVATLFSPNAVLDPLESWVIDMDYRGKLGEGREMIEAVAKELMPDVEFHDIDKEKKQLLLKTPDGITPLAQLSDGYQNVAAWCGDLLRWMNSTFKDYKDPLKARGLVLVDEIDLHLHPVWQRKIRGFFDRAFPNLQFIATTHSPLTVQQSGEGELFVLRRKTRRAAPTIAAFEGAPNTMMIHQLLLSPIFNLDSMDSLQVQKKRERFRKLKEKGTSARTANEKRELERLKKAIETLPDMAQGLSQYEEKQLQVLRNIEKALDQAGPNNGAANRSNS